ncbi:MAG TPA: HupE/UreJ family protein [Polyangiales bacterium]|nr:HupE/UreJ family protein [Polyangiales bacterium]
MARSRKTLESIAARAATAALLLLTASRAHAHPITLQQELPALGEYFKLGVEHILTGFDHLLFLAGLVLIGGRLKHLLLAVSAFTLAHSLTLALAVFDVVAPDARLIEVLIALSIAYVGVENLVAPEAATRWRVTFAFGLIHGFGFASALREIGVPEERAAAALALFNGGVEAGQLLVLAFVVPLLTRLQKRERARLWSVRVLSTALVAIGLGWAGLRFMEPQPAAAAAPVSMPGPSAANTVVANDAPRSIYPLRVAQPNAQAQALCRAWNELPRQRRAQCEGEKPGVTLASECTRMLSTSFGDGAVTWSASEASACLQAENARYTGCGWTNAPALPPLAACASLVHGTLEAGKTCRSSLECRTGLHCEGVGPLDTGVCSAAKAAGASCDLALDPLAAFVPHRDEEHRECAGACVQNRCR